MRIAALTGILVVASCVLATTALRAADITRGARGEVTFEGQIEPGDCTKLENLIHERIVGSIYIASPGGNLLEAMAIGRLVRTLKLTTTIPIRTPYRHALAVQHHIKDPGANQIC